MIIRFISVAVIPLVIAFEAAILPSSPRHRYHRHAGVGSSSPSSWMAGWRFRPSYYPRRQRQDLHASELLRSASPVPSAEAAQQEEASSRRGLYPSIESLRNGTLPVDEIHALYYREYGYQRTRSNNNTHDDDVDNRLVALFLHGGPGAGCTPNHARFFDPQHYRVVLFDQRGSGSSTPRGEIRNNSLLQLVQDCERLRLHLLRNNSDDADGGAAVPAWDVVLGGSWGTTLAIAYAQEYPNSVRSLVLRGVCLLRTCEVDWLFSARGGAAQLNPEGWNQFAQAVAQLPPSQAGATIQQETLPVAQRPPADPQHHRDVLHAYYDRLLSDIPIVRLTAARSWMQWEMSVFAGAAASTDKNTNDKDSTSSSNESRAIGEIVAVHHFGQWSFQDEQGNVLSSEEIMSAQKDSPQQNNEMAAKMSCFEMVQNLKQGLAESNPNDDQALPQLGMRPIRHVDESMLPPNNNNLTLTPEQEAFVPAQNMLTCYYSVNERFAMDNINLLSPTRLARIQHIPCIAVQGGQDRICPVDTALELAKHWPALNLRIPLNSGHSMYDAAITNELVRATDKFAKELARQ